MKDLLAAASAAALIAAASPALSQTTAAPAPAVAPAVQPAPPVVRASRAGFYIAAAGGRAQYDEDYDYCCTYSSQNVDSARGTSGKVGGGFRFPNGVAVEGWYFDFGKGEFEDAVGSTVRMRGPAIGAAWHIPFGQMAEGVVRGGGADIRRRRTGEPDRSRFVPYVGLGIGIWVAPPVAIDIGWDITAVETPRDIVTTVNALSVGVRVRF